MSTELTAGTLKIHGLPEDSPTPHAAEGIKYYSEEDQPKITKCVEDCIQHKQPYDDIFGFYPKGGGKIWVRANGLPVTNDKGELRELVGTFQDVTNQVKLLEDFEEHSTWLNSIIQNAPGMVYQYKVNADRKTDFPFISKQVMEIYEIEPEELKENPDLLMAMVHPEGLLGLQEAIAESAAKMSQFEWQGRLISKSGVIKTIYARSIPRRLVDGSLLFDGIMIDVSSRVRLEQDLEHERDRLIHASKLASIGELAAGVGHEINNPLMIIRGHLDLFQRSLEMDKPIKPQTLSKVRDAVSRIAEIVNGLRVYARQDDASTDNLRVASVVTKTTSLVGEIYQKDGIRLNFECDDENLFVEASEGRLQQVLMNLLGNARDAVIGRSRPEITIKTKSYSDSVVIEVQDNGCGINQEKKDKVFESFFTTKPVGQGTGMGLSISSELVKNMGGDISLESEEGKGTSFFVTLPAAKAENVVSMQAEHSTVLEDLQVSVLILDDEEGVREVLEILLEDLGMSVKTSGSGEEALAMMQTHSFDIVFTDLKKPGMLGDQFIENARAKGFDDSNFVVITGGVEQAVLDSLRSQGFPILLKPVAMEDVTEVLRERAKFHVA
ncbi:MAG: PAS domain-containing protein [Bdellovibrionales bacterium]|nr:PAS domain-containing protein [Bdellovibrionales bacterium]